VIKLIVFKEVYAGFGETIDFAIFNQLARAYNAELQMIRDWSEAIIPEAHSLVIVDEAGVNDIKSFTHPENAVYVIGRTSLDVHQTVPHNCAAGECVRIDTPNSISLFGHSAAAIVLSRR